GNVRDYTALQGVRAAVLDTNPKFPETILVEMNARNRHVMDVYKLDLRTGALVLDTENPGDVVGWDADNQQRVRAAQISTPDGGTELRVRDDEKAPWRTLMKASMEENLNLVAFTPDDKGVYLESSLGNDTARVV